MFGLLARGGANFGWAYGHSVSSLILNRNFHSLLPLVHKTHPLRYGAQRFPATPAAASEAGCHREGELANPPQILVGEIHLFFVPGAFQMTQSRLFRNTAQILLRYPEQVRGSGLGNKFWDIIIQIVHGLPQSARLPWRPFGQSAQPFSQPWCWANFSPPALRT